MLPIEFYQKLDSKYRKLIYSLDKELENSKTHIHYHEILKSFAELYMIPWQYWKSAHISNYYGDKHYLTLFSLYQFYYSFKKLQFMFYRRSQNSNRRCFKHSSQYLDTNVNLLIHDLQVPHCDLKEIWKLYEQNICSFPPKNIVNIYHKMRDLYDKIISVEKDEEKWMKALMESKNNEFVLQNVECRLGGDLNNKKLWKLYFEFLKQNDIEKMLQTYSKYCRFFLSDVEMLDEYQAAVEEHGTITQADIDWWSYFKSFFVKSQKLVPVPWKNTFNFEMYDEIKIRSLNHELPDFEEIKSSPSPLELFFTSDNAVSHNFYFRASFINYIQQNASAEVQQKLKMSCKYFHINFPVTIIYKLIVSNEWQKNFIKCNEQSIKVSNYEIHKIYVDKIYLTTKLEFSSPSSGTNALSNFLRKIVKCSVKYLSIYGQNLSFNEFNLLVGHGEVLELCLLSVKIYKAKNEMLAFEDMLKMLPKIEDLIVSNFWTSKETNTELLKISFKNKFKTLSLKLDKNFHIDAAEIFKFLKKNACSTCKIYINLKMHRSLLDSFQKTIDENINAFWRGKEKPYFEALRYKDDCKTFNL